MLEIIPGQDKYLSKTGEIRINFDIKTALDAVCTFGNPAGKIIDNR
jgi:hypothetical protein